MEVRQKDKEVQMVVASAGDCWYEAKTSVELLTDGQDFVDFFITSLDTRKKRMVRIPLEGFPERPARTTRISVTIGFLDENTMAVVIKDKGFGELFPATDTVVRQEVMI